MRSLQATLFLSLLILPNVAAACPNCATSTQVWSEISVNAPGATLTILTLAFGVVAGLIVLTARLMNRARLLVGASLLLGAGLGAFLDGIVLHQVLQWHAMISSIVAPTDLVGSKVNMFWDGIFHLFTWLATVVAMVLVVKELSRFGRKLRNRVLLGGSIAGWGYFNIVEGIIDHHIFGLHHVHPGFNQAAWDVGFITFGVLLIAAGAAITLPVLRHRTSA
jgi:uncharacterized membrane protein